MKFKNFILLLFSLLLTWLCIEIGFQAHAYLQLHREPMFQFDSRLGWRFIPSKKGLVDNTGGGKSRIQTNEAGFRDHSFIQNSSKKKIAVLGDSFVSNTKVRPREVFTEILEKSLPDISVMNFGVNGYGQVQEYFLLGEILKKHKPDLVIVFIYVNNDFFDNMDGTSWEPASGRPYAYWNHKTEALEVVTPELHKLPPPTPDIRFSLSFAFFLKRRQELRARLHRSDSLSQWMDLDILKTSPDQATQDKYRVLGALMEKMADLCQKAETPLFFAIAPSLFQVTEQGWNDFLRGKNPSDYDLLRPNRFLKESAKSKKLSILDLYPRLRAEFLKGIKSYDPKELHWNAEGNRIVADEILKFIRGAEKNSHNLQIPA